MKRVREWRTSGLSADEFARISEEHKLLAGRSASRRYAQFVEHVSRRLAGGHRFLDDLSQEPIADEGELARLAVGSASTRLGGDKGPG